MMKISDVEKRIDASYNTIKRFIEKKPEYHKKINNVLHATDLGLEQLELEYGLRSEIISDDSVDFYKSQIFLLKQQLEDHKKFNEFFTKRIEDLEKKLQQYEIEKLQLKYELELEKNKSIWKKIFRKGD